MFLPRDHKDFPVVLFVHGGSWLRGDKNYLGVYSSMGACLARQGIGVIVTNYRLSPAVMHPEHIKDVARAFAWVHKNVNRYGGRADHLFVCGHSAGGHLVSLLATDESFLKAEGLTRKAIRGVIPMSGIYDVPDRMLPAVFGVDLEKRRQASPIRHVQPDLPPFLILYADRDLPACDKAPSEAFCKALRDKGNQAETVEVLDSNHFKIILSAAIPDEPVTRAILRFIQTQAARP
jgi:acetyl esterase/lipase